MSQCNTILAHVKKVNSLYIYIHETQYINKIFSTCAIFISPYKDSGEYVANGVNEVYIYI